MKTLLELERYERRWKRVFAVSALVLIACIVDLFPMRASGAERVGCYSFGTLAALIALLAARRLGDPERAEAVINGEWLNAAEHVDLPSLTDADD